MIEKRASTQDLLRSSAAVSVLSSRSRRSRRGLQIGSVIGQLPLAKIVLDERSNPEKYTLPRHPRLAAGADYRAGSRRPWRRRADPASISLPTAARCFTERRGSANSAHATPARDARTRTALSRRRHGPAVGPPEAVIEPRIRLSSSIAVM